MSVIAINPQGTQQSIPPWPETRPGWAEVIKTYQEIPPKFRAAFPEPVKKFPYTVWVPEEKQALLHKHPEKLICLNDNHVVIFEALEECVNSVSYSFHDLLYLSQGIVLLQSWMTFTSDDSSTTVAFNAINAHEFETLIAKIRQGIANIPSAPKQAQTPDAPDELRALNFKFRRYAQQSIQPQEKVISAVYQPEQYVKTLTLADNPLFKRYATGYLAKLKDLPIFQKPVASLYASDHLTILTDHELILIKEHKPIKTAQEQLYGGVTTYIPLRKIKDIAIAANSEQSRYVMKVKLTEQIHVCAEFDMENTDLDAFQLEYAALKSKF